MKSSPKSTPKDVNKDSQSSVKKHNVDMKKEKYEKKFDPGGGAVIPPYMDKDI